MAADTAVTDATLAFLEALRDEATTAWVAERLGLQAEAIRSMDPSSLRPLCCKGGYTLWHAACERGRTDVCEYLKSKGLLDLIEQHDKSYGRLMAGWTPLHIALVYAQEETAKWMMDNGADINAINGENVSVFRVACAYMSTSFVEELAGKVAPEHLTMCDVHGKSPMQQAFLTFPDPLPIVRMLILRGVPATPEDFPALLHGESLLPRRRDLLASLEADLNLNDRTFLGLFLAAGVHAPTSTTACATTTTTTIATTKRVRTQRPDGSWGDPVTVPCEPRRVVTAAPTARRSGQGQVAVRVENHLPKLRGFRNTQVRMEIAGFLGVRGALDLARLRAVRDVVAAVLE